MEITWDKELQDMNQHPFTEELAKIKAVFEERNAKVREVLNIKRN